MALSVWIVVLYCLLRHSADSQLPCVTHHLLQPVHRFKRRHGPGEATGRMSIPNLDWLVHDENAVVYMQTGAAKIDPLCLVSPQVGSNIIPRQDQLRQETKRGKWNALVL